MWVYLSPKWEITQANFSWFFQESYKWVFRYSKCESYVMGARHTCPHLLLVGLNGQPYGSIKIVGKRLEIFLHSVVKPPPDCFYKCCWNMIAPIIIGKFSWFLYVKKVGVILYQFFKILFEVPQEQFVVLASQQIQNLIIVPLQML